MSTAASTPGDFIQSQDNPTIPRVNHSKQAKSKIIKTSDSSDGMDFDDLLPYVGEFGLYQKKLFAFMIPFTTFLPWVYFVQIFITLVPTGYWCRIPELANLTQEQRIALAIPPPGQYDDAGILQYSRCSMYGVNFTEIILRNNRIIPTANRSWPITKCQHGWEYNFTDVPYETIATEDNWVCDQATLSFAAQSIFFVGAIVGCLIFGRIADRYGRIPALVGANMMACLAGILTTFTTNFWQFALCRFFFGLAFDNCFAMMYILVLEYVGPQWRTFVANMSIAIFFTMSSSALPWIAYYIADWRLTSLVVSVPMIITIATPWLIPESARWLASQGQVDRAIDILKKMEKVNGTHVPDGVYKQFKDSCELETIAEGQSYSSIDLFKSPRLRKTMILLIIIWMLISLVFDGHVRNINNLGLDIFLTFSIAAATEFPADVFLTLVLDRWGRRWIAFGLMCVSGIFSIWACAVTDHIFSAGLAIVGRFCMNITYNIGLQYAAELLPTVVRAQGVTLIHITGFIASIISPFIVYLAKVSPFLPLLLLGIFGLIGGVLVLLLPETLNHDLPQTLQDGEDFGRDQGFWDMPCLLKKADKGFRSRSTRSSGRPPLRGEIFRSSIIARSRKNIGNIPVEVSKL